MFDGDLSQLSTADLLESAVEHRAMTNRADARLIEHAQIYADRNHPSVCPTRPGRRSCDGRERAVVLGGEGCPEIVEFAVAEFGVLLGISAKVAADFIGQALALRHRFPFMWARVRSGEATPWKARLIVESCAKLSEEAAAYVDKRVAPLIDSITPYRLDKIIRAAKFHAAPDLAQAEADQVARERGVYLGQSDQHGTKTIYIRTSSGHAIRYDATIARIAEALKTFGDTRSLQTRRSEAVGIIADPLYTQELLNQAREHLTSTEEEPARPITPRPSDESVSPRADRSAGLAASTEPSASANPVLAGAAEIAAELGPGLDARARGAAAFGADFSEEDLLDDEADRDAPHPGDSTIPDPFDGQGAVPVEPFDPGLTADPGEAEPMDPAALRALSARLARIKHDAYARAGTRAGGKPRPGKTEIYVHLTDCTLAVGTGVMRAEAIGPLLASQLTELIGYGPYTVKPVIDLNDAVSVDAYEIPDRIRERIKLMHPVELFPFGTRETNSTMDLDHIQPYDPLGRPGQTNTDNLAPLGRFSHRVKTHAPGWKVRRVDHKTLEWTTPHGFVFRVDPTGTHRVPGPRSGPDARAPSSDAIPPEPPAQGA